MQIFTPFDVVLLKAFAIGGVLTVVGAVFMWRSVIAPKPAVGAPVEQVVPFSHKHHVGDDGIDCRYCHASVETSANAGLPALSTCMNCHSQLFSDAPILAPLRDAFSKGAFANSDVNGEAKETPFVWRRVHDLPDFAYFDHSIHIAKGVGCSTCHGRIDTMPLTSRIAPLTMQWCLECHRAPERALRPQSQIFSMDWRPPPNQLEEGRRLAGAYHLRSTAQLTSCSTCHR